jgi:hypothetical protein
MGEMMRGLTIAAIVATSGVACASLAKYDPAAVAAAPVPFPFDEWDALLKKYVDGVGRVNYAALKSDSTDLAKFERVFNSVAATSPKKHPDKYPSKAAKEAFYLDAYNVLVWKSVLMRLPKLKNVDSEKVSFFYSTDFLVGGDKINLRDLEGEVVRPLFKDGRVHMALNCASGGCPQLPAEAFTPAKLDAQLDREARKFCNEKRNVDYDAATKTLKLSHIFDWYKGDFGKDPAKVIHWIDNWRATDAQIPIDVKIDYVDYDWTLNDPSLKR